MKSFTKFLIAGAFGLTIVLYAVNIFLGPLNLDEGWYLYAAKSYALGERPYQDFFFTQAPLLPAIYGFLSPLWSSNGVLGGRVLSATFGLLSAILASLIAISAVPKDRKFATALTVFLLLGGNVYHSYFTAIPKTYALAAFFTTGGFFALSFALREQGEKNGGKLKASKLKALLIASGGFLLALAAATRLSLGAMLLATGIYLLCSFKRTGIAWLWFGVGGLLGLAVTILPHIIGCYDAFAFANFFHGGREAGGLVFTLGSISRLARNYFPVVLIAIAFLVLLVAGDNRGKVKPFLPLMWLSAFALTFIVHVLSPFPYDDYQVPLMPLATTAFVALFWQSCSLNSKQESALLLSITLIVAIAAFTSPLNESWVVVRKDRFWVETKQQPDIQLLRNTAKKISESVPAEAEILTQDTYLAVDADRRVPKGFEMGPFGYFPNLSDEEARKYHVLNKKLLVDAIESTSAPIAAASGYAFSMGAPEMTKCEDFRREILLKLNALYPKKETVPNFGQEHTTLEIFSR